MSNIKKYNILSSISEKEDPFNSTKNAENSEGSKDIRDINDMKYIKYIYKMDKMEDIEIEGVEEIKDIEYINNKEEAENEIASTSRIFANNIPRANNSTNNLLLPV